MSQGGAIMLSDEDEVVRFFQFNKEKTTVTLVISTSTPMQFEEYLDILNDFIHEQDVDNADLFQDNSFLVGMN